MFNRYRRSPQSLGEVTSSSCCGYGAVEVKCPQILRDGSLQIAVLQGNFYVKYNPIDGKHILDHKHSYHF